jgi:hypothetical protein
MHPKQVEHYDVNEVAIWLNCIGLSSKVDAFIENGVDGEMLVALTADELTQDLGLSGLQAKKIGQQLEFTKELTDACNSAGEGDGGGGADKAYVKELEAEVERLNNYNAQLLAALEEKQKPKAAPVAAPAPAPAPVAAPAPAPAPAKRRGAPVLGGAARGAAGGAMKGAIVGAIVPGMDASDGAKAGAAAGGAAGGLRGLAGRRRR